MRPARSVKTLAAAGAASIIALSMASFGAPAFAQDAAPVVAAPPAVAAPPRGLSESVAAVVNDDIVSSYDLMQRMRLLMVSSGVQPTEENLPQLEQEALRSLIDEHVQLQELRRVEKAQKITIISTEKEVDALARQCLAEGGVPSLQVGIDEALACLGAREVHADDRRS